MIVRLIATDANNNGFKSSYETFVTLIAIDTNNNGLKINYKTSLRGSIVVDEEVSPKN